MASPVIGTSGLPISLNTSKTGARHVGAGEPDAVDRLARCHQILAELLGLGVVPIAVDFGADLDVAAFQGRLQALVPGGLLPGARDAAKRPDRALPVQLVLQKLAAGFAKRRAAAIDGDGRVGKRECPPS